MITVFTPTYNRKELLKRCYISLKQQSDKNFEWLIVDDGSTDNTQKFVEQIKKEDIFNIKYIYQENGGKHRAYNTAVKQCNNEYFFILDSDDILTKDCIEVLNKKVFEIASTKNISGIIGNKQYINNKEIIGTPMPNIRFTTGLELYQKYKFKGDTLRLYKTSVLKDFLFPEIEKEKFISENVVFDRIDEKYKLMVIKEVLYQVEYQENGYTNKANRIKKENPIGYSLSLKSAAETAVVFKKKINWTILYIIWCRKMKIQGFGNYKNKLLYIILLPLTFILDIIKVPKFFYRIFEEK